MKLLGIALLLAFLVPRVWADSITMNSGDVLQGEIISETDSQVTIRISNANHSITYSESIPKSDIKTIEREAAEARSERERAEDEESTAYKALSRFQLNPNQEMSAAKCAQGMAACNEFLGKYPKSKFLADVQQRLTTLRNELGHVEKGEVKFNNAWMTPKEKKPLMEAYLAQQKVQGLEAELKNAQEQRDRLIETLANTRRAIAEAQNIINNPPQTASAAPPPNPGPPRRRGLAARLAAPATAPQGDSGPASSAPNNNAVNDAQSKLAAYQAQAAKMEKQLADLGTLIEDKTQKLAQAKAEADALHH